MILPQMEQPPLYNSINFSLSVAYCRQQHVQHDLAECLHLPLRRRAPDLVPVFKDPPDPAQPGSYSGMAIDDTVARGNYVGMFGVGEICASSGANSRRISARSGRRPGCSIATAGTSFADIVDGSSQTIAVGERSHNLSYVTWTARSIDGWLGKTSLVEGGTDQFNPSPEECWTQVLGPAGLEDGPRRQRRRGTRRGLLEPPPRRRRTSCSATARSTSSRQHRHHSPGGRWRPGRGNEVISTDSY